MAKIHRIGEPENDSEMKAIRRLAEALPDTFAVVHNFELTTGHGLPYEYDVVVVGDYAVYHVEVKGYRGAIRGDANHWIFENDHRMPSPIPLANKKSKILASRLMRHSRKLKEVWVETCILLTDDRASTKLRDDQAHRVITMDQIDDHFTDQRKLPVGTHNIEHHHWSIFEALFGQHGVKPVQRVTRIGLYDIVETINQTDDRSVFIARHRYIKTRPMTILKVFHFDAYTSDASKQRQIEAIFHDQDAMRLLGAHPNLIDTMDMFAWDDTKFVLPTEYIEAGRPLELLLEGGEDRQIEWAEKADIIRKMAQGLKHAHGKGVIHRDIRPFNVVVAPGGVVKLVNFDLALIEGSPHPHDAKRLRKKLDPRYVAPEVWEHPEAATPASDIYALGIVFYQLITSQTPYAHIKDVISSGEEAPLDLDFLRSELATPGSEDFMGAPDEAIEVMLQMTRQDPTQRYQSVDEIIEDLSILRDE